MRFPSAIGKRGSGRCASSDLRLLFSLDASQKEALVEVIATLLKDRSTITIGSAIMAFNEVCPHRYDLIHPCFRKLCGLLADCDEWGQMTILDVLLRYGRQVDAILAPYVCLTRPFIERSS